MPTALIVEDEPEANRLLAMLVQLRGYQTTSAFTGREALSAIGDHRPDVVFLDLMLPDINGYEVCRSLRTAPATATIPVVMVTARLADENRTQGFEVGAAAYVPKPYTPDQIFQAMAQADAWRLGAVDPPPSATIRCESPRAGCDWLRDCNRLRSALLARGLPDPTRAARLDRFLDDLARRVVHTGTGSGTDPRVALDYRRESDRLTLTIRADPAVLDRLDLPSSVAPTADPTAPPLFDRVVRDDAGRVVLSCLTGATAAGRPRVDPTGR